MRTLAFDLSASPCSMALAENDALLAQRTWSSGRESGRRFFPLLDDLLRETGGAEIIGRFAVGLGPGSYAGLRMALAAARAMALPGRCPVYGISGAETVARVLTTRHCLPSIAIIGDARQDRFWCGHYEFSRGTAAFRRTKAFRVFAWSDLNDALQGAAALASPHWSSIGNRIENALGQDIRIFRQDYAPCAADIARFAPLYGQEDANDGIRQPLAPIYLSPGEPLAGGSLRSPLPVNS